MATPPSDTIFGKIVRHEVPAKIIYQDDEVTAFQDTNPVAPVHVLLVPNKPIRTLNDASAEDGSLIGKLILKAQELARRLGIAESGYRLVINCNQNGGQSVYHLHIHLLGGRKFAWPPG